MSIFHRYVAVCKPHKAAFICTAKAGARQVVAVIIFCTVFELPVFLDNSLVTQMDANNQTVLVRVLSDFALNNYYQVSLEFRRQSPYTLRQII